MSSLRTAPDSATGELLVLLAQSLERLQARDSAAAVYQRAAVRFPAVADWLRLRAIGVIDDSTRRAALIAQLVDPLVRGRAPWADAAARERTGDLMGAARDYTALGAHLRVIRLRLALASDGVSHAAVRQSLLAIIRDRPGNTELREAVAVLDSAFAPLTAMEQLAVARSVGTARPARALEGYTRAFAAKLGTAEDRFDYATALFRLGRYGDAAFQFNLVRQPRPLAALAAYQRARALVRDGQLSEARTALLDVARKFPRDTAAAASALYLLADLATDRQDDTEARRLFRQIVTRYPSSRVAAGAQFRAAIIAFAAGQLKRAAKELDDLPRRHPTSDEATAATYWAGRAFAAAGDRASAKVRWETVAGANPLSYYASLSARRLNRAPWAPVPAADSFVHIPAIVSAIARAALLMHLGLAAEARLEYARLANEPGSSVDHLLTAAFALRDAGRASEAIQLARLALERGAPPDARLYRLLYPIVYRDALRAEAAERGLDPSFVAALIRQESRFDPAVTSPVGARGLMQIMPQIGAGLAQAQHYPVWDPVLLYQPDVSLQLGVLHLQELTQRYDTPVRVLAAYNAGTSRVERWDQRHGVDDPELFAERIPFAETRDYVRIIQRNQELYRTLYQWPEGIARAGS